MIYNLGTVVGRGINSIEKISTEGTVDTYRVTFTDATTFDFTITNADIATIEAYIDSLIGNIETDMLA